VIGPEKTIRETYVAGGQVKIVFSPMLDLGPTSLQAALAAECAGEQGQFWPMHDLLFERQRELYGGGNEIFTAFAAELGLDTAAFQSCMDEQRYAASIQAQDEARRQLGIRTRPTIDINGQLVVGAQSFDRFQSVIDDQIP
jgi:protein-disulfide isomerase